MKTLNVLIWIIIIVSLTFCSKPETQNINVEFYKVDGLQVKDKVLIKGVEVGEVSNISLHRDMVLVNLIIDDQINIPLDSKFILYDIGIMGRKE